MNEINYYQEFEKQIKNADAEIESKGRKPTLLLQACCCPCSSHCLEVLTSHFDVTVFFYNPNIDEVEEFQKRLDELYRFTKEADFALDVKVVEGDLWIMLAGNINVKRNEKEDKHKFWE